MKKDVIAIVGAGKGGTAILETLLYIPKVKIKYVCDINNNTCGVKLAAEKGIKCVSNIETVCADSEIDLIIEVTGNKNVYEKILQLKHENTTVIGAKSTEIIFHFLDYQNKFNKILEQQVKERTLELEKINEDLQKINDEKTKYLMHATHQLKAPFAAIQSYADIILDGYAGKASLKIIDIIKKVKQRCSLLSKLIKEMLELANLKTAVKENIKMEYSSVDKIVDSVTSHLQDIAVSKDIRIIKKLQNNDISVKCNRNQILILLSTLVENAISYSEKGKDVVVDIQKTNNNKCRVSVIDQGIGIENKHLEKIFNEYFRTNRGIEYNQQGTGLGLAIAKEISDIHHTNIEVESRINNGSKFSFELETM